jgi:hypothetical protein
LWQEQICAALGQDQRIRVLRQLETVQHGLQQRAVIGSVADQHGAQQALAVVADHDLLVDRRAFVRVVIVQRALRTALRVADAGDVHAHQLELGAHVGAGELFILPHQMGGGDPRHLVAGRDQPEDLAVPERAFADGVDVRVRGPAVIVDHDTAAFADAEPAVAGQLVARAYAGGKHDHIDFEKAAVRELHAVPVLLAVDDARGVFRGVHLHAQLFDLAPQQRAAHVVDLHRHQPRREFDDVGFEAHVLQRVGALESEQAAADDGAGFGNLTGFLHGFQVLDGAVHMTVRAIIAWNRRHKGIRTRGENQLVVAQIEAPGRKHALTRAVDDARRVADMHRYAVLAVKALLHQGQVLRRAAAEKFAEMHPIVGQPRLLAEHGDRETLVRAALHQRLDELVADHAVADDHDGLPAVIRFHWRQNSSPCCRLDLPPMTKQLICQSILRRKRRELRCESGFAPNGTGHAHVNSA